MFSFFARKKQEVVQPKNEAVWVDMHSHILPGLDDGAESIEDSIEILRRFLELGYKKAVLTPHIMSDAYKNTPRGIREKLHLLTPIAQELGIQIEAAAEYYIDEGFYNKLLEGEEILSFGQPRYVLMETSYINEASYLAHVCFELQSKGFTPVLAHPERYTYLYNQFYKYEEIAQRGILFQLNINSLVGYYSPTAQKIAEKLIDKGLVHFIGTDCHSLKHTLATEKAMKTKYYQKLLSLPLLNNSI
jgi:tyrosine-protein phosphatase YwqE